jgi:hypothetical protein
VTVELEESPTVAPPRPRRRPRWLIPLLVAVLLTQMAGVMVVTAVQQTPTIDEPVYVGTAVTYLEQRSLRYNPEHPPLGKIIIAAGVAFAHPRLDPAFRGYQTALGRHVLYEAGNDPYELMFLARLPMIILTLLFGLVVFAFARDLVGPIGGLLALTLYAFSPDVIAHGSLATLDVPAVGFLLTAFWLTWRARARPYLYLPLAGLALGAALATRMNALPMVPLVMLLAFLALKRLRGVAAAVAVAVIAFAVVWVAYLIVDPRLGWVEPTGMPVVSGLRGLLVDVLPVPEPYRDGMRIQFAFEDRTFRGFLFGHLYRGSLWFYLPVALLVKTPIGMMLLWLGGTAAMLTVRRLRIAALYLILPAGVLLTVAMTGARDFGTRYAIFMPIFGAVVAAAVVTVRWRWARVTAAASALFVAVSSLLTFPYYLPYSNEAFGGPEATHRLLHDSNVDWGQDLGRLADRLRERYPGEPVWLVYRGAGVPAAYGINAPSPYTVPEDRLHGLLVVSDSAAAKAGPRLKALIASSGEPIDEVGHSMTIYRR